jgi:peptidoglycan/LPS O-acetylase OafA/YrhL
VSSTVESVDVAAKAAALELPERLPFIEGVRGLAALVVVLGHCINSCGYLFRWPGQQMVYLFLVVSGFSLAYSEDVRRSRGRQTSVGEFALRRVWRILPTYYVALGFGLLVLLSVPRHLLAGVPSLAPIGLTWGGQLSHLLLLHNLHGHWLYQDNGPLWSIAYEAQAYLFFPLLYAASKRLEPAVVAGAAICANLAVRHFEPTFQFGGLLGWFALGIALAFLYRSPALRRIPTGVLLLLSTTALVAALAGKGRLATLNANGLCWAVVFGCALLAMTRRPASPVNPANAAPLRWLGVRSYSLYALHFPVLWSVYAVAAGLPQEQRLLVMLAVAVPLSVLAAWAGYLAVEQPSLRRVRAVGTSVRSAPSRR